MEKETRVTWNEFDRYGYDSANELYHGSANPKEFEKVFTGVVIEKYVTFWGTPKFVVALPTGEIRSVPMTDCRIVIED